MINTRSRIGNSIHVSWRFWNNNGTSYALSGKIVRLILSSASLEREITAYGIQGRNELTFTIPAGDLVRYGVYRLVLSLREAESETEDATYDAIQLFEVVSKPYPDVNEAVDGIVSASFTTVLNNVKIERIEGLSAYEIAVNNGYEGTEQEWIAGFTEIVTTESARAEAEAARVLAETTRQLNEAGRIAAESSREIRAAADHQRAEADHDAAEGIGVVKYNVAQNLTSGQKSQARTNIGAGTYSKPAAGIPAADLASGVIPDVSGFVTKSVNDLLNYYLKSETYTKAEVQALINAIQGFSYEAVSTLPTASASTMGKIYLTPSTNSQSGNVKDEWITLDNGAEAQTRYTWEQIGSTAIDLSGYVTTQALNTALANYTTTTNLTTLLAGKQDKIDSSHKLDYSLISNTPTIPAAQVNSDWNAASGVAQILNKPTVDNAPTEDSNNLVKSGGVYDAIEAVQNTIDGNGAEVVTSLPTASASTVGKIYYVGPDGNGEYARYRGIESGGSYTFLSLGTTNIDLTNLASKKDVEELDQILDLNVTTETVSELIPYGQHIGYIGSNAINNQSSGNNRYSDPIFLKAGESLKIKAITATNVGRLASYDPDTEAVTTLLMGQSQGTNSASYAYENTYTATDDIYLIVGWWWDYVQLELTKTYTKKTVTSRLDEIDPINEALEMETESGTVTEDMALTMTSGEYYSGSTAGRAAGLSSHANMSCSNVFDFKKGDVFEIKTKNAPDSLSVFSIKDGTLFRCVAPGAGSGEQTVNYTAPYDGQGAVSFKTSEGITVKRTRVLSGSTSLRLDEMEEDVDAAVAAVNAMSATVASLDASVRDDTDDDLTQDIVSGKFINHAGGVFENEDFAYKEFDVRAAAQIRLVCVSHDNIAAIAKKISSTEYQELVAGNAAQTTFEYTATENMTIAVSFYSTHDRSIEIRTDYVDSNRQNIVALQQQDASGEVRDIRLGYMFDKIAVIGDSMSVGTMDGYTTTPGASWLSFLAKRWGCSGKEFYANGGSSAYSWLNNASWGLGKLLADTNIYNAYFVAYGHNDSDTVGDATDAAAPVTTTGGTPSCPDGYSFCAYLKAIVSQIRAKNPRAMIFLLSQYDSSMAPGGWHSSYGEAVIDVAEALYAAGDKLVHHLDTGGVPDSDMELGAHYSTVGYAYIAKRVNDEANKVIYQYRADTEIKNFGVYNL